jgi:hypothetical protein
MFFAAEIKPLDKIFIVWNIENKSVDVFDKEFTINNIDYLWYPSSDDIELIDDTCNWVMFIRHFEYIKLVLKQA